MQRGGKFPQAAPYVSCHAETGQRGLLTGYTVTVMLSLSVSLETELKFTKSLLFSFTASHSHELRLAAVHYTSVSGAIR